MMRRMLIVYYSVSNGNTRRIAGQLQKATGADLAEIETVQPYTGSYQETVDQGQREVESGFRPAIKPLSVRPEDYDVIAVGTPTWWYTMAPAVLTFLTAHDWRGKTIIPFQTHGGWPGHAIQDMESVCRGAAFVHPMEIRFDSSGGGKLLTPESEIESWVQQLKDQLRRLRCGSVIWKPPAPGPGGREAGPEDPACRPERTFS